MLLGYNTNGMAHHRLGDAIELIAQTGYRAVAITLDHAALDPFAGRWQSEAEVIANQLKSHRMVPVIETGARYLLDSRRKHWPTLISPARQQRARRSDFIRRAIEIATILGSQVVSLWSGAVETSNEPRTDLLVRLAAELTPLIEFAGQHNLTLAFEPEPGMLISTLDDFADLLAVLNQSGIELSPLGLTLDVVHLHCQGETPIADRITQWSDRLANVHLADAPAGRHEHLMFGEGSIQFAPVLATLEKLPSVPVCVELSRHSHMAVDAIRDAFSFVSGASRGFDSGGKASR